MEYTRSGIGINGDSQTGGVTIVIAMISLVYLIVIAITHEINDNTSKLFVFRSTSFEKNKNNITFIIRF